MARSMPGMFMFSVWDRKRSDLHLSVLSLTSCYTAERVPLPQKQVKSLAKISPSR